MIEIYIFYSSSINNFLSCIFELGAVHIFKINFGYIYISLSNKRIKICPNTKSQRCVIKLPAQQPLKKINDRIKTMGLSRHRAELIQQYQLEYALNKVTLNFDS